MRLLALALAALALAGCTNPQGTAGPPADRALAFQAIEGCSAQSPRENYTVISDPAHWAEFWRSTCGPSATEPQAIGSGGTEPPAVDFSRNHVIVALWGEHRTGGFDIKVRNVTERADDVRILVERDSPGSGCMLAQFVSHPFDLEQSERITKAPMFAFSDRTVDCG